MNKARLSFTGVSRHLSFNEAVVPGAMPALIVLLSAALFLASCSTSKNQYSQYNSQDRVLYSNASLASMDADAEQVSQVYHHYLLGQLLFSQADVDEALKNLSKVSEMMGGADSTVHSKLARLYIQSGEREKALEASTRALKAEPEDTDMMLLHAGILESLERYDEAEPIYISLIEKEEVLSDAYILLSNLYLQTDRFGQGETLLLSLIEKKPDEPSAPYFLGRAYEGEGDFERAESFLKKAQKIQPLNKNIMLDRIRVLLKADLTNEAKKVCEEILQEDPENEPVRRILGHILIGESRFDEAIDQLEILRSVEKDPTETRLKLALIHMERGSNELAIRELSLLLAREPDHGQARFYLATLYAGSDRESDALDELSKIKVDQKIFSQARNLEAFILRQKGDLEAAQNSLLAAYQANPQNLQALIHLSSIMREAQKYDEAEPLLRKARTEHPDNEQILFQYGVVLHDLKQKENSISVMREVIALNPRHADALNFIAYTLAEEKRDLDEALILVEKALEIDPENGYYIDTLGWIQYQAGRYEEARDSLARAVDLAENDVVILVHYADSLVKTGDTDKAIGFYKAALRESDPDTSNKDEKKAISRATQQLEKLAPRSIKAAAE